MALLESDAYDGAKGGIGHSSSSNGSSPNLALQLSIPKAIFVLDLNVLPALDLETSSVFSQWVVQKAQDSVYDIIFIRLLKNILLI